ncbi:MAG: GDSL-type esterase/lipase family protein [Acidobacteria bacterium]|nr:GDSL-type esterase/lipase family protein [Acidobacteriota bacterium]
MKSPWFANLVLILAALLALSGALLVSPPWDPSRPDSSRQWAFSGALLAAAGILVLCLRLPVSARIVLSVTLLSIGVGLYAMEGAVRWQNASRVRYAAARAGNRYDPRMRLEVLQDLRRSGVEAWPLVFPADMSGREASPSLFPLGGISKVTTVHCNEIGPYLIYRSDEHGFQNPPGLWELQELQVALVGDSFAQGNCVASDQNAAARIRADFPGTLNLGMEGNGPLAELAGIREFLPELHPRQVVWVFCAANDLVFDLPREKAEPILRKYLEPTFRQGLRSRQDEVDTVLRKRVSGLIEERTMLRRKKQAKWDYLQGWLRLRMLRHSVGLRLTPRRPSMEADVELLRSVLEAARDSVSSWGGKLYFVYLPSQEVFLDEKFAKENEPERQSILKLLDELDISLIDLLPAFQSQKDPNALYAIAGAHFNPQGYQLMGKTIADALKAGSN